MLWTSPPLSPVRMGQMILITLLVAGLAWGGEANAHSLDEGASSDQLRMSRVELAAAVQEEPIVADEHSAIGGHCHPSLGCSLVFVLTNDLRASAPAHVFRDRHVEDVSWLTSIRVSYDPPPPK